MPRFSNGHDKNRQDLIKVEPRCHVCQHSARALVDQMLVAGLSYSEIERQFENTPKSLDRKSISNHAQKHLGYEDAAIRNIIERKAEEAFLNVEKAEERLITKGAYLRLVVEKGWDALINDSVDLKLADTVKAIELLDKLEEKGASVAIEHLQIQFQAFIQAVKDIVPVEDFNDIIVRMKELLGDSQNSPPVLNPPSD